MCVLNESINQKIADPYYSYGCLVVFFLTLFLTAGMLYLIWKIFKKQSYADAEKNIRVSYENLVNSLKDKTNENENLDISKKYWIFKSDLSKVKNGKEIVNKLRYSIFNLLKTYGEIEMHSHKNESNTTEQRISGFYDMKESENNILFKKYEGYYQSYYEKDNKNSFKKLDKYFNSILNANNQIREILAEKIEEVFIEYLQKTHHK